MRRFDPEYLRRTREGMWADDRSALADLDLPDRRRVLDVGCGTGEFTRVLATETDARVVGVDADPALLSVAAGRGSGSGIGRGRGPGSGESEDEDRDRGRGSAGDDDRERGSGNGEAKAGAGRTDFVAGDACRLPFRDGVFDLVVCQALLINLPDPVTAVREFGRTSGDLVAAVEPDNAAVAVESTVDGEADLEARAREAYLAGVETDVTLGAAPDLFRRAGLDVVATRRYDHVRTVEPPYDEGDLDDARRKATGAGLVDDRATMLAGGLSAEEFDRLRADWRAMGRSVVAAMQDGEYRRRETVPFFVTVGRV